MTVSLEYLGHVIDRDCLHPLQEKLHTIQGAPESCNITELNYYAKFLPNLANILFLFYRLLQKNIRWM